MERLDAFIPSPPPSSFKSKVAPPDDLHMTRQQQYAAPLYLIEKMVGAGVENRYFQVVGNKKGQMGVVMGTQEKPQIQVGGTLYNLEGDWKQEEIVFSEERLIPVGPAPYAPEKTGWYIYYYGMEYPRRGWVDPKIADKMYPIKRGFMNTIKFLATKDLALVFLSVAILPKRIKIRIIERFIKQYMDFADLNMSSYYVADEYRMTIAKSVHKMVDTFFETLGVNGFWSDRFGEIISHFIEYDDAYRYRFEDVMTETSQEKLLANPGKELQRLLELYLVREHSGHVAVSLKMVTNLLRLVLLLPWIKRAFKAAIKSIEFKTIQLDEIDRYHVRLLTGYDFFGETIEERIKKYPQHEGQIIRML